ncbi:MAG: hypothetical protein IPG87_02180 [Saprospiraceae bacterium]|nr:hypothetical protein [Candidatus Vicinibacter affinis]
MKYTKTESSPNGISVKGGLIDLSSLVPIMAHTGMRWIGLAESPTGKKEPDPAQAAKHLRLQ